jgi:anti-sigma factor RsiW
VTCRELADFLMDYLSGELPEAVRVTFEQHLARCPDCVNYLAAYKATVELNREAFASDEENAQTTAPEDLIEAVLDARRR